MYKLIKNNIERIVESEPMRDKLIADGFELLVEKEVFINENDEEKINISDMTLEELKAIAKEKGIEKYSSMKKADLIEIIEKLG